MDYLCLLRDGHLPCADLALWHGISLSVMFFPFPRSRSPAELTHRHTAESTVARRVK